MDKHAINKARAVYYGLFASLLTGVENPDRLDVMVQTIEKLIQNPLDEHSQKALNNMLTMLSEGGHKALKEENDNVFFNPYSGFIPVTASYYDEKRDDGKKRLEMVNYVLQSTFRRDTETFKELEDHIGFIVLFMQKLIEAELAGDMNAGQLSAKVFTTVLNGFIDEFIANLHRHPSSCFYAEFAVVLHVFIELERLYLGVSRPAKEVETNIVTFEKKVRKEFQKRGKRDIDEMTTGL
jgi:TorA maturation chaperone TorD